MAPSDLSATLHGNAIGIGCIGVFFYLSWPGRCFFFFSQTWPYISGICRVSCGGGGGLWVNHKGSWLLATYLVPERGSSWDLRGRLAPVAASGNLGIEQQFPKHKFPE